MNYTEIIPIKLNDIKIGEAEVTLLRDGSFSFIILYLENEGDIIIQERTPDTIESWSILEPTLLPMPASSLPKLDIEKLK